MTTTAEKTIELWKPKIRDLLKRTLKIADLRATQHRLVEEKPGETIADLAKAIEASGQLYPIFVHNPKSDEEGPFSVIDGHRRLRALKELKRVYVDAIVLPRDTPEDVLQSIRATGNRHLEENPLETGVYLASLVVQHRDSLLREIKQPNRDHRDACWSEAEKHVAQVTGRTVDEVRRLSHLARLCEPVRKLYLEGRLPHAHSRAIARVNDHQQQAELAKRYCAGVNPELEPAGDLAGLRRECAQAMISLADVPWRLDKPTGKLPACIDCPHNSNNAPGLFTGDPAKFARDVDEARSKWASGGSDKRSIPDQGVCTNTDCYRQKRSICRREVESTATKVLKHAKSSKVNLAKPASRDKVIEELAPDFISTRAVAAELSVRQSKKLKKGKPGKQKPETPYHETPKYKAERLMEKALEKRVNLIFANIHETVNKTPGLWAVIELARMTTNWRNAQKDQRKVLPIVSQIKAFMAAKDDGERWQVVMKLTELCKTGLSQFQHQEWQEQRSIRIDELAKALGFAVPPRMTIEQALAQVMSGKTDEEDEE